MSALLQSVPAMILMTGALVALSGALLGTFLVLRGQSMASDAISHAIVLGIVLAWFVTGARSGPLAVGGAALAGLASVLGAQALARTRLMAQDAALGLVFPAMFALGVLLINLNARNLHLDIDTVLLGEIGFVWLETKTLLGLELPAAAVTLGVVAMLNAGFITLFWKELKLASFDPGLASAFGFRPGLIGAVLLALTSATAVAAFDAVGVVLFMAFLIVPPVTGLLLSRRLWAMLAIAVGSGLFSVGAGYALAIRWDVSIGGMMAVATGAGLVVALVAAPRSGLVAALIRRRLLRDEERLNTLLIHLASHSDTPDRAEECTEAAFVEHLHWTRDDARAVILSGLDRGLIRRDGALFSLTEAGAARAGMLMRAHDRRRALPPDTR
ncbi:MAG: manganese/zinc/iron transport system permease protein [Rhodobacteraceae bacterium HLUCCA12]|nr:MAG: manganese/zinc/iron transport system permease protein [Rhodobacteraceae bacterium HLUCCA12]